MNRGLQYFIFLVACMLIVPAIDVSGQGREETGDEKNDPPVLKGIHDKIDDVDVSYCSQGGSDEIYVNSDKVPDDASYIVWNVKPLDGSSIDEPTWYDEIVVSGGINGIEFYPDQVDAEYYGDKIRIEYTIYDENDGPTATGYDDTRIYKSAEQYSFGSDIEICEGSTGTLTLINSETGYEYTLLKDDSPVGTSKDGNDGVAIDFEVSEAGIYEVEARRIESDSPECPILMDGAPEVTVNPLPNVTASSPDPDICEGETIYLEGGPDNMESYSWEGPNGWTSDQKNPEISDATVERSGTYTLTVNDENSCEASANVDIAVYENPTASPDNDGPVCEGGSVTVNANPSGGSGNYTFEWTKTGDGSFSETTQSFTFDPASLGDAGEYNVMVTDDNGCQLSTTESTTVEVNENPVVNNVDNDGPVCEGGALTLSADVSGGSGSYTYEWTGPEGFTSTDESPVIENITTDQAGDYELTVTDDSGCVSNTGTTSVTVNALPSPTASNDGPACEGSDIQLTGDPDDMSYSWTGPEGFTSIDQNPLLTSVDLSMAGDYTLTVVDGNGCENSDVTTVEVDDLQEVELDNDGPVCEDGSVTLEATVTGGSGDFSYYWEKDGAEITGATESSYTIDNASLSDDGTYEVFVTDESSTCGTVSATSSLVVNENPVVDNIDNDGPACEGEDVQLSVSASGGSGNYSYSWTGPDGFSSDEQNPVVPDVTTTNAGDYEVVVTDDNGCSSATATTTVDVNENPTVDVSNDGPVCEGEDVVVSASASGGSGPFSYKWFHDGTEISETSSSFTISGSDLNDAGTYEVEVTDDGTGCVTTESTDVVVNENPTVSLSEDMEICEGEDATFTATASGGDGNYVYTWYYEGSVISGASGSTYTVSDATTSDAGEYEVVVTDGNGCDSDPANAQLTVNENPDVVINSGETETDICLGGDLVLDANATDGSGTYSYEWVLPDNSTQTGQPLTVNDVDSSHDGVYTVTVTDDASGCIATDNIQVNVVEVNATISATASTICVDDEVTFTADGGEQYEFFHYDQSASSWTSVQGPETENEWSYDAFEDGDLVYANVENSLGCDANTDTIEMTVYDNPTVDLTFPSGSNETCDGEDFTVEATEGYSNYIFYVNGSEVQNSSEHTYTSDTFNDGDEIYVTASSGAGCTADSDTETITVHPLPSAEASNSGPVCEGFDIVLQGGPDGMAGYEWFEPEGNSISTSKNHDLTGVSVDDAGIYTLRVTDGNGCEETETTEVVVHEKPSVDLGDDFTACEGTDVEFVANVSGGTDPYDFYWEKDGSEISGVSTSTYTINNVDDSDEGSYTVTVTDDNGCVSTEASVQLTVKEAPVVSFDTSNSENEVCEEESIILETNTSGGDGNYTYEWYHDGDLISGVSTSSYTINNSDLSDGGTYEVIAIDGDGSGCESASDAIDVTVHQLPDATLDVDPEHFIEGQTVELIGGGGDEYAFFVNGDEKQARSTDNVYETSQLQDGDSASVQVYSSFGCRADAYQIVTVYDDIIPPEFEITNQQYCEGETVATVQVTNPIYGVTYEIVYNDESATSYDTIEYNGSDPVEWSDVIDENSPDGTEYYVKAYWADVPDDYQLSDLFEITEYEAPETYPLTVDGVEVNGERTETCTDGDGYEIGLEESWGNDTYVLFLNGDSIDSKDGGPSPLSFGHYSTVGEYTIMAYNDHCPAQMNGRFILEGDDLEIFELSATDEGKYCEGGEGVDIELSGSEDVIEYILYRDGTEVANETGDNDSINFGQFSQEGSYYAEAESSNGCKYRMDNVVEVEVVSEPDPGVLTAPNEGHYCADEDGIEELTLEITQEEDVLYQLIDESTDNVVDEVEGVAGEGDITFNNNESDYFDTETTYFVRAAVDPGCEAFSNEVEIVADPLPQQFDVEIFQEKCGSDQAIIGIEESESDVEYILKDADTDSEIEVKDGDDEGGPVDFSVGTGNYLIEARRMSPDLQCTNLMGEIEVEQRDMPATDLSVTDDGGSGCDDPVVIGIDNPETDVTYQLFTEDESGDPVYMEEQLTGNENRDRIEFEGIKDVGTTYYIEATTPYGCRDVLDDDVFVDVTGAIERFALTPEEGDMCNGDGGFVFELESSESDVEYELWFEETDTRVDSISGTGDPLEFNPVLEEGEYYVIGRSSDDSNCDNEMLNRVDLTVHPLPQSFNMIGPGAYCDNEGAVLGVDNSEEGMTYILQRHYSSTGKSIVDQKETETPGDTLRFDAVNPDSKTTYSVVSKSEYGCTSSMKDTIEVEQMSSPDTPEFSDYSMYYCSVEGGKENISPENFEDGVTYRVFDSNDELVREVIVDGGEVELGPLFEGSYMVRASWDEGACSVDAPDSVEIEESVMPIVGTPDYDANVCYGEEARIAYDISEDDDSWNYSLGINSGDAGIQDKTETSDSIIWKVKKDAAGSYDYYIEVKSPGGVCSSESTQTMEINFAEELHKPQLANDTIYYCESNRFVEDISLDNAQQGVTYRIFDENDQVVVEHFDADPDDLNLGSLSEGTYVIRSYNDQLGCVSPDSEPLEVIESPMHELQKTKYEDFVCAGDTGEIFYDVSNVDVSRWEFVLTNVDSVSVGNDYKHNGDSLVWEIEDEGTYYIKIRSQDSSNPCGSVYTDAIEISFSDPLDRPELYSDSVYYCPEDEYGAINLQASNISNSDLAYYLYEAGNDAPDEFIDRVFNNDSTYFDQVVEEEYVVRAMDVETGCYSEVSDPVKVEEYPKPEKLNLEDLIVEEQWDDTLFMEVDQITLDLNEDRLEDHVSYYFNHQDSEGLYFDIESEGNVIIDTAGTYKLYGNIDMEEANCLPEEMDGEITILEKEIQANNDSLFLPEGVNSDSVNVAANDVFSDIDEGQLDFRFVLSDDYSYSGEAGDFTIQADGIVNFDKAPSFYGEKEVEYLVQNNNYPLRADTATLYVYVGNKNLGEDKSIFIPNAFSPNDDGVNDVFEITVDKRSTAEESTLEVYNRWGTLVYRSDDTNYDNSWDGTANVSSMVSIGDELPNGVYFYVYTIRANVDGEIISEKFNGYVELRR